MKKIAVILTMLLVATAVCSCEGDDTGVPVTTTDSITTAAEVTVESEENNQIQITNDDTGSNNDNTNADSLASANTVEELENIVAKDIEDTVSALNSEWETLSATITTYDDYIANSEKVEHFYEEINTQTEQACIRLQEYAVRYAEMIMASDMSADDKYDAFDDLNDCIYDDAADDLKDGIYDGLLDDMKDALYDGVLDDSDDASEYSDWYDVRSDEYDNWSDTRSDVYKNWSDTRSDLYGFCSDMRSELWGEDIEKAQKNLEDYKDDVEKLK